MLESFTVELTFVYPFTIGYLGNGQTGYNQRHQCYKTFYVRNLLEPYQPCQMFVGKAESK